MKQWKEESIFRYLNRVEKYTGKFQHEPRVTFGRRSTNLYITAEGYEHTILQRVECTLVRRFRLKYNFELPQHDMQGQFTCLRTYRYFKNVYTND